MAFNNVPSSVDGWCISTAPPAHPDDLPPSAPGWFVSLIFMFDRMCFLSQPDDLYIPPPRFQETRTLVAWDPNSNQCLLPRFHLSPPPSSPHDLPIRTLDTLVCDITRVILSTVSKPWRVIPNILRVWDESFRSLTITVHVLFHPKESLESYHFYKFVPSLLSPWVFPDSPHDRLHPSQLIDLSLAISFILGRPNPS